MEDELYGILFEMVGLFYIFIYYFVCCGVEMVFNVVEFNILVVLFIEMGLMVMCK